MAMHVVYYKVKEENKQCVITLLITQNQFKILRSMLKCVQRTLKSIHCFFFFFSFILKMAIKEQVGRYFENWDKISEQLLLLFTVVIYGILWNTYLTNNLEAHIYGFRHKRHETIIPENFHVKRFPNDRVAMPKKFSSVNLTFGGRNILLQDFS